MKLWLKRTENYLRRNAGVFVLLAVLVIVMTLQLNLMNLDAKLSQFTQKIAKKQDLSQKD